MIPKIIHYCWFGGNPIPAEYKKYIESWRKYLPDYEIREWNESNYDVDCIPFSKEAYEAKKYAYVSDYARLKIIYENGGIYFDTDVELIKSIDDILQKGSFLAFEKHTKGSEVDHMLVNVGLGFACEKGNPIIKEIMNYYEQNHYILPDGTIKQIPIVYITTDVLKKHGLKVSDKPLKIDGGFIVYPWEYFCPMEYLSSKIEISDNTRTIHHYTATWMSFSDKLKMKKGYISNKIKSLFKKNMIVTKQALRECIQFEQKWYENYMFKTPRRKFLAKIKSESFYQIMNWQRISRMTDYYHYKINSKSGSILSKILYIYYIRKRNILSARLGLEIGTENIGKGLVVYHYNNVVNGLSKIGENLHLHGGNVIGNAGPQDPRCPTIGNNVMLGAGAKVIGNVYIADNIKIAAGAVVVNSFDTPGITIAGVPAKRVK